MVLSIQNEYAPLQRVVIGRGSPYQRDKAQVAAEMNEFPQVPDTDRRQEVLNLSYPSEVELVHEYRDFVAVLERYGVKVLLANPDVAYSFDYTCPRDIGFVIGSHFFIANMAVQSRANEIETIRHHLTCIQSDRIEIPQDCLLEGGDVIVLDDSTVLAGFNRRSNRRGAEFLQQFCVPLGIDVIPVPHRQLHLDCCLNPLGANHLLIHPGSLEPGGEVWPMLEAHDWIEVENREREYLATNVLSINPNTIIARSHESCARVNRKLAEAGYNVEQVDFDGVPATGGSFRCASLPLERAT